MVYKTSFPFIAKLLNKQVEDPIIAIDVGCRWGFADKFLSLEEGIQLYGFDPDQDECAALEKRYNAQNIHLIPLGLSNEVGQKKLYITKEPACSSLYKPSSYLTDRMPALQCAKEEKQADIDVTTLDIWAKDNDITRIDYLKLDTQGSEYDILQGGNRLLSTVRFLEIEVEFNPIYEGQPLFSDIDLFLRSKGLELWGFKNFVHYGEGEDSEILLAPRYVHYDENQYETPARGGQLFWADAIYVHKEIVRAQSSIIGKGQRRRDLILADALGMHDIANRLHDRSKGIT